MHRADLILVIAGAAEIRAEIIVFVGGGDGSYLAAAPVEAKLILLRVRRAVPDGAGCAFIPGAFRYIQLIIAVVIVVIIAVLQTVQGDIHDEVAVGLLDGGDGAVGTIEIDIRLADAAELIIVIGGNGDLKLWPGRVLPLARGFIGHLHVRYFVMSAVAVCRNVHIAVFIAGRNVGINVKLDAADSGCRERGHGECRHDHGCCEDSRGKAFPYFHKRPPQ